MATLSACGPVPIATDGSVHTEARIVGGEAFAGLPAVGALTYWGSPSCSGTLIEPRKVLTAAHCLVSVNPESMAFVLGQNAWNPLARLRVESVHPHPQYNAYSLHNDIGYALLSEDAPVAPMRVLPAMDGSWRGTDFFFVGYGVSDAVSDSGNGIKRAVWMSVDQIRAATFLYADPTRNTCSGDSGGPAFHRTGDGQWWVAGVTSYGDPWCGQYGVDTRADVYLDFLDLADPEPVAAPDPCGGETYVGRCDGGEVVWCEDEDVRRIDCHSQGIACGWDTGKEFYNCLL